FFPSTALARAMVAMSMANWAAFIAALSAAAAAPAPPPAASAAEPTTPSPATANPAIPSPCEIFAPRLLGPSGSGGWQHLAVSTIRENRWPPTKTLDEPVFTWNHATGLRHVGA